MAGDTANAALWEGADVFVAVAGTAGPTDTWTDWAVAWEAAGLLSGTDGFTETRDEDKNDYYAWGNILVKSTKTNQRRTIKFVALEDNEVVFNLINPGSTRTTASSVTTSVVKTPTNAVFAIGFELHDGDKVKRRSVLHAQLDAVGDKKESEDGLASVEITVVILPESDGTLYQEVSGPATDPGA